MSRSKQPRPAPELPADPDELERAGAELITRMARLRATIERKRRQGWDFNPRAPDPSLGRT